MLGLRPLLIVVGGSSRGSGKTTFAVHILQTLTGWGAIKYTFHPLYSLIVADPAILSQEGKDTKRYLDAGATEVLWVQSPRDDLDDLMSMAISRLSALEGILIEGNSAIIQTKPDVVLFVCGDEKKSYKKSASAILSLADAILYDTFIPPGIPAHVQRFRKDHVNAILGWLSGMLEKKI